MTNKYSEEGTQGSQKITLTDFTDDDVHDCDHVNSNGVDDGDSDEDFAKSGYLLCGETKQALERALQSTFLRRPGL